MNWTLETVDKATQFYYILEDCSLALTPATESASICIYKICLQVNWIEGKPYLILDLLFLPYDDDGQKRLKSRLSLCSRALKSLKRRLPSLSTYIVEMIHFRLMQFFCAEKGAYLVMDSVHTWKLCFGF